ncbi:hypothetical protein CJO82_05205 [Ralstonia solanacearum]|nr:hypothetical protein CJO82_05205 [Ralstonia solanacearum]AXW23040.1 hypothetical protein CJO86_05225 [Ralstonia solanacearum]AXW79986.1 hypothetical protein CJO98_05445 [Ralstonia solanacearum]
MAKEGLPVGDAFGSLTSFHKGQVVSTLLTRLLDQLDEQGRPASVHEWECLEQATRFLMAGNTDNAFESASEACKRGEYSDYPGGGQTRMLRAGLATAIDILVSQHQA